MSALGRKVMDLAEQQGLLDGKAIAELRKQVAESKFVVTPEAIAKVLVDHGHLTPFQARRLVSQAQGNEPDPVEQRVAEKKPKPKPKPVEDLTFADPADRPAPAPKEPEVVDLEPMEPEPKPAAKNPSTKKPSAPAPQRPKEARPPKIQQPAEGSTADDFVDLEPVERAPANRGTRWKTDPTAMNETIELTPIDLSAPAPAPGVAPDLVPIDDLFGPDPFGAPAARRAAAQPMALDPLGDVLTPLPVGAPLATPLAPVERPTRNVWDSPLMLIGGGALGVILVLFALLFYALTRGTAAELFSKAEEEYRAGSYSNALVLYEKFIDKYPDNPEVSLARVRRGMATLRQVTDDGKNPRLGLDTAKQVLPEIEKEEKFGEARGELAMILPDIADGFATQAEKAQDGAKKGELVELAGEALALVNNPAYLPASLRKDRESHIARIVDKLRAAERGIQQDKDLAQTVEKITAATEKGNAAAAYKLQSDLLRLYPGLAASPELVAAIKQVGEKERQLVTTSTGGPEPFKDDHADGSERVVISFREQEAATNATLQPVFALIEGAVYGIDAQSGRVLWRRFVGYESTVDPVSLSADRSADALLIDTRHHELLRVKGINGELVWRQKLSGPAMQPVVAGNRILLTTRKGAVIAVEAATGQIAASAQLPQGAEVSPAVRQQRLYQLGEHSTLFVLDANSLACTETVYLGHRAGEILVAPAAVLDQLLVIRSPADDYSEIQVVGQDAKTKRMTPFGKPQRLKGRVVTPLSVSAARVAVATDLGQVAVYEVDAAGATEHVRLIASLDASETSPRSVYCELERNRLWVASHRSELFDVQSSLSQLARRWTQNHDDSFVAPLRLAGEILVQIRRRNGVASVLVEGCRSATSGDSVWTTHVAAPIAAMVPSDTRQKVNVLTADGRLYQVGAEQVAARQLDQAAFSPQKRGAEIFDEVAVSADQQTLVWTETRAGGRAYVLDVRNEAQAGANPAAVSLPVAAAAAAMPLGNEVIAPLTNGTVVLLPSTGAATKIAPFMPPLVPDALPQWTKPVALADGKTFLISDGRGTVYAVVKRDGAQPQLIEVGQSKVTDPVASSLVLAGSTVMGVVHQQSTDAIAGFDSKAVAAFEPLPLEGRVEAGPFAVGGLVFVAAEPDGLVCVSSDGHIRWQQRPEKGTLAGPPVACPDGDLLVPYQSGLVCRVDPASGNILSQHDVGEPLLGPVCIVGSHVYATGSDGVVHRIELPKRP